MNLFDTTLSYIKSIDNDCNVINCDLTWHFFYDSKSMQNVTSRIDSNFEDLKKCKDYGSYIHYFVQNHDTDFLITISGIVRFFSCSDCSYEWLKDITYSLNYLIKYKRKKYNVLHEIQPIYHNQKFIGLMNKISSQNIGNEDKKKHFSFKGYLIKKEDPFLVNIIENYFIENYDKDINLTEKYILNSLFLKKPLDLIATELGTSIDRINNIIKRIKLII